MQTERLTCLKAGSVTLLSRLSGTLGTNLEVLISPSRLDEDSCSFNEHHLNALARNITSEPRSPHKRFPRELPGKGMAISRDSYRRRDLWRLHVPHRVLPCHIMLPHTLVGLPASIVTLLEPSTSSRLVR